MAYESNKRETLNATLESAHNSLRSARNLFGCMLQGANARDQCSLARDVIGELKTFISLLEELSSPHLGRIRSGPLLNSSTTRPVELTGFQDRSHYISPSSPKRGFGLSREPRACSPQRGYAESAIKFPCRQLTRSSSGTDISSISRQLLRCYFASPSAHGSTDGSSEVSSKRKYGDGERDFGRIKSPESRRVRIKRTIQVPVVGDKFAEIPFDDFSWRKYGQKSIKDSPHPRNYYRCSFTEGCPARKHVERCFCNEKMWIVTYEGNHSHPRVSAAASSIATVE